MPFYKLLPGGSGIRSVSRYVLTLSLPLAIGFAYALDRFLGRPHSKTRFRGGRSGSAAVGAEQLA